ncbi:proton myo-inositol cotransporter-like protein [Dinothrombium tinctorium]|uniref:Proton myo-inositol cotransporter-like protein n=1 Tax=Dinothrombium tinctorium TaxID=1965070 RepID=A0A3S3PAW6_9ACAR|nr:proton myo-inositol cotransporter-like protein [Dinothrombium tinctorium]
MLGLAAIPAAIQFVGFFFMPESPRYLVKKGKNERALKILKRTQPQNSHVEKELEEIKKNCEDTNASQDSPFTVLQRIFKTPTVRKALFVGCCLQIFQQIVGINTVMYYTATIIEISGVKDKSTAIWLSSLVAFVPLICNFSSFYFIEKLGRRITLLFSLTGVVLSLFVIGAAFQVIDSSSPQIKWQNEIELLNRSHVSSLKCINVNRDADCNLCISYAECGVCYEVNDNYVKMSCLPIDFNTNTTTEFGMCQNGTLSEQRIFWNSDECPNFQKKIYSILIVAGLMSYLFFYAFAGAFFLYACFGVIGLLLFYKILPETKGISLEETETLFIQCSKEKPSSSIKPPA